MAYKVVSDYTQGVAANTNVQVFVRARPPASGADTAALAENFGITAKDPKRIEVKRHSPGSSAEGREHAFSFDQVFWTDCQQDELFRAACQHQVKHCIDGYNSCNFAYGQTGSGKVRSPGPRSLPCVESP